VFAIATGDMTESSNADANPSAPPKDLIFEVFMAALKQSSAKVG
jgi:hypothetical protein